MIYLDNAATTPLDPRVEEAMLPLGRANFGNPSSPHAAGRAAHAAVDEARDKIADILGARSAEIIFTSGGTEADNLAVIGCARAMRKRGNHIITTAIEHHAVLGSAKALEGEGFNVTCLRPDENGVVHSEQVVEAITPKTTLVSVMYANNETGVIQPIADIGRICRERGIIFHTDAVQAAGELPLRAADLNVDLMSISAHKFYGPKGVGALYSRAGTPLKPLLHGGAQEHERRAGTENVAGVVGMARGLSLCGEKPPCSQDLCSRGRSRAKGLRDRLIEGLLGIAGSRLHGEYADRLSGIVSVAFSGVPGEALLVALDLEGIAVSTGAACASGAATPSHVLQAMGYSYLDSLEAVRFSPGRFTTEEEITTTIEATARWVRKLRENRQGRGA